jgi:hypothetical protein
MAEKKMYGRGYVVEELAEIDVQNVCNSTEEVKEILINGFRGYQNFSDEELVEKYEQVFGEEITITPEPGSDTCPPLADIQEPPCDYCNHREDCSEGGEPKPCPDRFAVVVYDPEDGVVVDGKTNLNEVEAKELLMRYFEKGHAAFRVTAELAAKIIERQKEKGEFAFFCVTCGAIFKAVSADNVGGMCEKCYNGGEA